MGSRVNPSHVLLAPRNSFVISTLQIKKLVHTLKAHCILQQDDQNEYPLILPWGIFSSWVQQHGPILSLCSSVYSRNFIASVSTQSPSLKQSITHDMLQHCIEFMKPQLQRVSQYFSFVIHKLGDSVALSFQNKPYYLEAI